MTRPRLVMVLTENWTIASPRELRALIRLAREAEAAGIDGVMLSDHLVLGASAGAAGRPWNPKDYAAPGNQDPATPWPDSIVLMSAIAAVTTRLRLIAAAIIAPLRHPILLAHQLAALDLIADGRLVVQPTVSWHEAEYAAVNVPFAERGARLDEHLLALEGALERHPSVLPRAALLLHRRLHGAQARSSRGPAPVVRRPPHQPLHHPADR